MVHFPGFARTLLYIQRAVAWFYQTGFPHSEIPGSKLACSSPGLIAACHVLHRLLAPRHPPYALSSLTIKLTQHVTVCFQKNPEKESGCRASSPFHILLCSSRICRFSYHVQDSCESRPRYKMPAYSVVKELCVPSCRTVPLPVERSLPFYSKGRKTIKTRRRAPGQAVRTQPDGFAR